MATRQIPVDVMVDILVLLPVKTLLRFESVCNEWYNLINSSNFIKLHLNKSLESNPLHNLVNVYIRSGCLCVIDLYRPFELITEFNWPFKTLAKKCESPQIVGLCHGLVCCTVSETFSNYKVKRFLICNPSTRDFRLVRASLENCCLDKNLYGFGYDSDHDDYKIVVTSKRSGDVSIYSLKADLWRRASSTQTTHRRRYEEPLIFANNMLHCLVSSEYPTIARFDFSSEAWTDDLILPVQVKSDITKRRLGVIDGRLYLHLIKSDRIKDVWMMEEYGKEDTWSLKFRLPETLGDHNLVTLSKDEPPRLLVIEDGRTYKDLNKLAWYDQQDKAAVAPGLEPLPNHPSANLCGASLVSIPWCSIIKMH